MLSTFILIERDLHDNELFMIVRSDTSHGPTSGSMVENPNCKACAVDGPSHSKECRERFEAIFLKEEEEKALMDAAAATATSMATKTRWLLHQLILILLHTRGQFL